jgi:hypothetical protein
MKPYQQTAQPQPPAYSQRQRAVGAAQSAPDRTVSVRSKRWPLILSIVGGLVAAGVAITIYATADREPTISPAVVPASVQPSDPPAPAPVNTTTADDPAKKLEDPKPLADPKPVDDTKVAQPDHSKAAQTDDTTAAKAQIKHPAIPIHHAGTTKPKVGTVAGKRPEDAKTPPKGVGPGSNALPSANDPGTQKDAAKGCDPFGAMHKCHDEVPRAK